MANKRIGYGKIRKQDLELYNEVEKSILTYSKEYGMPLGISDDACFHVFILQIIDSVRRIKFVERIMERKFSNLVANPNSIAFDPLKAAVFHIKNNNIDEACWLIFLSIHFGKHKKYNWNLVKAFYGKLGDTNYWTWENTKNDLVGFQNWLQLNETKIKSYGAFGNHRKYSSLKPNITGEVIKSYIRWVDFYGNHINLFNTVNNSLGMNSIKTFKDLYKKMNAVYGFGRMGKFDFLCMIGKMKIVDIFPGEVFLKEATGPKIGCSLLFGNNSNSEIDIMNDKLNLLEKELNLDFGMQILEDAICNWQKNPKKYIYFKG